MMFTSTKMTIAARKYKNYICYLTPRIAAGQ